MQIYHTADSLIESILFIALLPSNLGGSPYIIKDWNDKRW